MLHPMTSHWLPQWEASAAWSNTWPTEDPCRPQSHLNYYLATRLSEVKLARFSVTRNRAEKMWKRRVFP